jgi:hypothetical protein
MNNNGTALINRLVRCGVTRSTATDICQKYAAENRWGDLEEYIRETELYFRGEKKVSER